MCNRNWIMIALALCVLGGLVYFMKQSDFMKKEANVEALAEEVGSSMDTEGNPEATEEEGMEISEDEDPYATWMEEEEEIVEPMQ